MNITYKERAFILRYIYIRKLESMDGKFVIKNQMQASTEALEEYDNMSTTEKIKIYGSCVDLEVKEYLYDKLYNKSMFMYFVNGCPEKRKFRIREYADYLVRNMGISQKKHICEKLNLKFFDE